MIDSILVGDIGGTNARLAMCSTHTGKLSHIQSFPTASYSNLEAVIRLYLQSIDVTIRHACLAIACPVMSDTVEFTNHHWQFSIKQLQVNLQLASLEVINDFAALSMSIPILTAQDVIPIGGKSAAIGAPIAIYGAGTGLGVSHLLPVNGQWICYPGEGGHVDFASNNHDEDQILRILREELGHVSTERVLSGQGLVNIYHSIVKSEGRRPLPLNPSDISERALSNCCADCVKTLTIFCTALGSFGGNLALNMGALGGVYIAGGIVPRFLDFFVSSPFRNAFEDKGRFRTYLEDIPVFLIRHDNPGLLGAGAYFRQKLGITL